MVNKVNPREYAIERHGEQRYGDQPYSVHLDAVAKLVEPFGKTAITVAYLHDVVEDTATTLSEIADSFGDLVAECVGILTDEPGSDRHERKTKTYQKFAKVSSEHHLALIVKVADRLANVRTCIASRHRRLMAVYRDEHPRFRQAAFRKGVCDPLWQELDKLITHEIENDQA